MNRHSHTILQLIALGRLSPAEAERLLVVRNQQREDAWLYIACLLLAVLPQHAPLHALLGVVYAACSHLPRDLASLGYVFSQLHRLTGGLL